MPWVWQKTKKPEATEDGMALPWMGGWVSITARRPERPRYLLEAWRLVLAPAKASSTALTHLPSQVRTAPRVPGKQGGAAPVAPANWPLGARPRSLSGRQ